MTGLLESVARKLSLVWAHDRSVRSFSRLRRSPARLAFKATEKLDPDVSELLSTHCSWCVLDCGEAQRMADKNSVGLGVQAQPEPFVDADAVASFLSVERRQVLQMARRGIIPAHPLIGQGKGTRCMWRFRLSEVAAAVAQTEKSGFPSRQRTGMVQPKAVLGSKIGENQ